MNPKLRFALIGLVGAVGIAGVAIGYTKCVQPHEAVWDPLGRHWDHVPLSVRWHGTDWGAHTESFEAAIATFNRAAGCDLFVVAESPSADVNIHGANGAPCRKSGVVLKEDEAAGAYLCPDGTGDIQISAPGMVTTSYFIAYHELGHVIGLAHDDFTLSVMHEKAPTFAEDPTKPKLTDKDAEALKEIVKEAQVPIVADIHYDYRLALTALDAGIACLAPVSERPMGAQLRRADKAGARFANDGDGLRRRITGKARRRRLVQPVEISE